LCVSFVDLACTGTLLERWPHADGSASRRSRGDIRMSAAVQFTIGAIIGIDVRLMLTRKAWSRAQGVWAGWPFLQRCSAFEYSEFLGDSILPWNIGRVYGGWAPLRIPIMEGARHATVRRGRRTAFDSRAATLSYSRDNPSNAPLAHPSGTSGRLEISGSQHDGCQNMDLAPRGRACSPTVSARERGWSTE
jgi:hypothetical protein